MHCVILGIKQYPFNSLDQKNQSIVFTNYPHEGIAFLPGFVCAMQYSSKNPWCSQKNPKLGIAFLLGFGMVMQYPMII
jgi:hypothetical protein